MFINMKNPGLDADQIAEYQAKFSRMKEIEESLEKSQREYEMVIRKHLEVLYDLIQAQFFRDLKNFMFQKNENYLHSDTRNEIAKVLYLPFFRWKKPYSRLVSAIQNVKK